MPKNSALDDYIAGAVGGCAGLVVGHPLDTTKVQLQTQAGSNRYVGTLDCIRNINKIGWVRGFFRGLSLPVLSYGAVNSVLFGVYGNSLSLIQRYNGHSGDKPRYWEIYMAGCIGGAAQLLVACPVDLIKVVLQSQIPHGTAVNPSLTNVGPVATAVKIVRDSSLSGLYRGLSIQAVRDIPACSTYFFIIEYCNRFHQSYLPSMPYPVFNFMSGGIAGVVSWILILPFDVIKSRYQAYGAESRYRGVIHCAKLSYKEDGLGVFFRGIIPMSVRAFPVNAVTLAVYGVNVKRGVTYPGPWACALDIVRRQGFLALYRGNVSMAYRDFPSFGLYTTTYEAAFQALSKQPWVDGHGVVASLIAGGLAGVATWLPVIPFDVVKSRLQADISRSLYSGTFDCMLKSYRNEGLGSLFRGGLLICVRAFLVNAVIFLFYSQTLGYLSKE